MDSPGAEHVQPNKGVMQLDARIVWMTCPHKCLTQLSEQDLHWL